MENRSMYLVTIRLTSFDGMVTQRKRIVLNSEGRVQEFLKKQNAILSHRGHVDIYINTNAKLVYEGNNGNILRTPAFGEYSVKKFSEEEL